MAAIRVELSAAALVYIDPGIEIVMQSIEEFIEKIIDEWVILS